MATKTQVTDGTSQVTGTIGVYNQEKYPIMVSAPTKDVSVEAGAIRCGIMDISTERWAGLDPAPGSSSTADARLRYPTSRIIVPSRSKKTARVVGVRAWHLAMLPQDPSHDV
jgi:hypothetical protein